MILIKEIIGDIIYKINLKYNGDIMDIQIGDMLTMKKPHPCGSKEFEVLRIGADFKIKCKGCEHVVIVPRSKIEKNIKVINRE